MYLRHSSKILDDSTPSDSDAVSNVHTLVPSDIDGLGDGSQKWYAFIVATQSGGATSPTTDVIVETSFDAGTSWATVATGTQLTGDGNKTELVELTALGSYLRVSKKLGGGTKPSSSAVVRLASNGMYQLTDTGS